jgi:hypothetical protein
VGLVPGFEHDVFVSYAWADNGVAYGGPHPSGWVTTLKENLNRGPTARKKDIFIDYQLGPGDRFSAELLRKVERSAVLLIVVSQNYVDSKWCGDELRHFIQHRAADAAQPDNVFMVELAPHETLVKRPAALDDVRKNLLTAKFWYKRPEDSVTRVAGFPSPAECKHDGGQYWLECETLRSLLDTRLTDLSASVHDTLASGVAGAATPETSPKKSAPASGAKGVFVAAVTDDLEVRRNQMKFALEKAGIAVAPANDYVLCTQQEFDRRVAADLGASLLFVQLLSAAPGRKPQGSLERLPHLQFQRAASTQIPILQWCATLPDTQEIEDELHRELLAKPYLQVSNFERFKQEVLKKFEALRAADANLVPSPPTPGKKILFIDDAHGESELRNQVRATLKSQQCELRSLPAGTPLLRNGFAFDELLRPCRAAITLYSDRRDKPAVLTRLAFLLNQIADQNIALARWGVYFGPQVGAADVASELGIDSNEIVAIPGMQGFNEEALLGFVRSVWP